MHQVSIFRIAGKRAFYTLILRKIQRWARKEVKKMRISKILNNNSAVVIDNDNKEVVVIGRGIAFHKKVGDTVNPASIEKKFCLSSPQLSVKFQDVLVSLPLEEISIVEKIVDRVYMTLGKKISDSIYVSLSDHIHFALKNYAMKIKVSNNLMYEIMRFYPDEYALGLKGLQLIEEQTGVRLPDDEAGFIALHIVNAETENGIGTKKIQESMKIIEEVLNIVCDFFDKDIEKDSLTYYRFINHLKYFSQRVVKNESFSKDDHDQKLLEMMKEVYVQSYMCALNIQGFIKGRYNVSIGNEEMIYLIIHIQRAIFSV